MYRRVGQTGLRKILLIPNVWFQSFLRSVFSGVASGLHVVGKRVGMGLNGENGIFIFFKYYSVDHIINCIALNHSQSP